MKDMNGTLDVIKAYARDMKAMREENLLLKQRIVELEADIATMKASYDGARSHGK